jgi:hypothetical protein
LANAGDSPAPAFKKPYFQGPVPADPEGSDDMLPDRQGMALGIGESAAELLKLYSKIK